MPSKRPPARLSVLFARRAPKAVILRTGPVNTTRMILWNTETDQFTDGQWVKHKIYAERSSLSPDGKHLIYFAFKYHGHDGRHLGGFTALSRPPHFTALAMHGQGDTWGGGGLFIDERHIWIRSQRPDATAKMHLPDGMHAVYHPASFHPQGQPLPDTWKQRPAQFFYDTGQPAPVAPEDLAALDAHTRYGQWAAHVVLPPPAFCTVRDGCLYRRDAAGVETLLRDFNDMEFERIFAPDGPPTLRSSRA